LLSQAEFGAALLAHEPDEAAGRRLLAGALDGAAKLTETDAPNLSFLRCRIKVLRYFALGLAGRARETTATPTRRRECLDEALTHLDLAEALFAPLPEASKPSALRTDLERARAEVTAAKAQFGAEADANPKP
jgi:hypothetical protein